MSDCTATNSIATLRGGILLAACAGALAAAAVGSAPAAGATCASFFGIGNSADCTSNTTSIAVAIGTGATAHAGGLFGTAFAVGTNAIAYITNGAFGSATALGTKSNANLGGTFSVGIAAGDKAQANAGYGGSAITDDVQIGNVAVTFNAFNLPAATEAIGVGNLALLVGPNVIADAEGYGNTAFSLGGAANQALAFGALNNATNIFGSGNIALTYNPVPPNTALASASFTVFGSGNKASAGPGPLALAGSILQSGQVVTKLGPGFNINGVKVGGASAVRTAKPAAAAAHATAPATSHSGGKGTGKSARTSSR